MLKVLPRSVIILLLFALQACGTSVHAPVTDLRQKPLTARYYIVEKGDTLFAIAWRFNFDYKKLAAANKLSSPYLIKVGQRLRLSEARLLARNHNSSSINASKSKRMESSVTGKTRKSEKNTGNTARKGVDIIDRLKFQSQKDKGWLWPTSGKVVRFFSPDSKLSKGIDIAAKVGTPVITSRSGKVVYAGSRLKGYGNLIIVRHDEIYLSAYAHNRKILVKEGDLVQQGQKIAELGNSGAQKPKLHFEIRKYGKPIDPLKLLAKVKKQ